MAASSTSGIVLTLEQPQSEDANNQLSNTLLWKIFRILPTKALGFAAKVCPIWETVAADVMSLADYMQTFYPELNVRVIDETFWNRFNISGLPKMSETHLSLVDKYNLCERIKAEMEKVSGMIEGNAGATLFTMPPISLRTLRLIAKDLNDGVDPFRLVSEYSLERFGDIRSEQAERMLIANNILDGSRGQLARDYSPLVEQIGWEVPGVRHVAALAVAVFVSSGKQVRLFGDSPETYVRTIESYKDHGWGWVRPCVGGFSSDGLFVHYNDYESEKVGTTFALKNL